MRLFFIISRAFWNCCCGICDGINILLALIAVHLTFFILLNSLETVIPLPDLLTRWAFEQALGEDLHADWSKAVFDLRGGVYLEKVSIRNLETGDTLLSAGSARVNWAVWHLLTGMNPPFDQLDIQNIQFYVPPGYSPSGLNEPAVDIKNLSVVGMDQSLHIRDLQLQVGQIGINLTGSTALETPEAPDTPPNRELALSRIYSIIGRILRLSPDLQADLSVDWKHPRGGNQQVTIHFILPVLKSSVARFSGISGTAALAFSSDKIHHYFMELDGHLDQFNAPGQSDFLSKIKIERPVNIGMRASGKPVSIAAIPLPSDVEVSLSSIGHPVQFLEQAQFSTSLNEPRPVVRGLFAGRHLFATSSTTSEESDPQELEDLLKHPVVTDIELSLHNARLDYFYPQVPDVRLLRNTRAHALRLQGRFSSRSLSLNGLVFADRLFVGATHFAHLKSRLHVDPHFLRLEDAHVQVSPSESATGEYEHHFKDSRFSLLAKGQIFPQSLDALLGKWWIKIFTHIQAEEPAQGDVAVWGQWNDPATIKHITWAHGKSALYRHYRIPELTVEVRSDKDWAVMNRLYGRFGEHGVHGKLAWRLNLDPEMRRPMLLDFASDGPWEAVVAASGISQLKNYAISGHPEVTAKGIIWNPPKNHRDQAAIPDLKIRLNTYEGSLQTKELLLHGLSLRGHVDRQTLHLDTVTGIFADGVITGSISIDNWQDAEKAVRHLDLDIFDVEYRDAAYQLTNFLKNPEGIRLGLLKNTTRGRADATLDLRLSKNLNQCAGNGSVTIRKADIGRIHILGGLSRSLSNMGLGFSTLDLNAASLEWQLLNSNISIPRALITGPVLNLEVMGDIELEAQQIALQANVTLFRGLASQVLAPVGDSLQFDLTGDLVSPTWQVRLNPFRWFQNLLLTSPKTEKP